MREKAYSYSFAHIYDDIMSSVPYDLWYQYLHEIMEYYSRNPDKIIDLACGTGNMTIRFARDEGIKCDGLDLSSDMLEIARKKAVSGAVKTNFVRADLRNFKLDRKYDMAFSLFDSLNYILYFDDLTRVFSNVYNVLKEDGFFVFDMNTISRLMSIEPGTAVFEGDNYTCFWEDIIDKKEKRWQVKLKIYFDQEGVKPHKEFHEETAYPRNKVVQGLKDAGFNYVDVFNAYTFEEGCNKDNRLYYVAFKKNIRDNNSLIKKIGHRFKWRVKRIFI